MFAEGSDCLMISLCMGLCSSRGLCTPVGDGLVVGGTELTPVVVVATGVSQVGVMVLVCRR